MANCCTLVSSTANSGFRLAGKGTSFPSNQKAKKTLTNSVKPCLQSHCSKCRASKVSCSQRQSHPAFRLQNRSRVQKLEFSQKLGFVQKLGFIPGSARKVPSGSRHKSAPEAVIKEGSLEPSLTHETEQEAERVKTELRQALEGVDRGIFGVQSAKKTEIEDLIQQLEALNPLEDPTRHLDKVAGEWRLLYSTISILGSRRTRLGLREFVKLGEFRQSIDTENNRAVNVVEFSVTGIGLLQGSLTIEASYAVVSPARVAITFERSAIVPGQLLSLFQKNYDLLLGIFNPEGWLDITYVDASVRVGRDNKGNVFLVERVDSSS